MHPESSVASGRRLAFRVDRLPAALHVLAPVWDQAPSQEIERALDSLVILPDDEQLLARRRVEPARDVREPAVAHVEALHDGEPKGARGLNHSSAHVRR
jgi:hypothetical protein